MSGKNKNLREHRLDHIGIDSKLDELLDDIKDVSSEVLQSHRELTDSELVNEIKDTEEILKHVSQKWIVEIVYILFLRGSQRFNDLKSDLGRISSRTLSDKLKMLGDKNYVERKLYDEHPPRVEYELTDEGRTVAQLLVPLVYYLLFQKKS